MKPTSYGNMKPTSLLAPSLFALVAVTAVADSIPIRGVTWQWCFADPGIDFCLRTEDAMAALGYNTIVPEFGPVLKSRHYASPRSTMEREDFRAFLRHAKERNLEVIPLLNALGHSERSIPWPEPLAKGLDMGEEENYTLLFAVLDEYLEDFAACGITPRYIHLGCDEASATLLANAEKYSSTPEALLLQHLLRLREYCRSRSLRMIIWHDMLMSRDDPLFDGDMGYHTTTSWKCRPDVPKDIILMYWNYEPRPRYGVVSGLREEGFEVWLTPWGRESAQRMSQLAHDEDIPAVVLSTWMDSGGASVRSLSQTGWMAAALGETSRYTLYPETCAEEPPDDPVLRCAAALFPAPAVWFRKPPATSSMWRTLEKPDYLARHAADSVLLGKWPDGKTNFADLTPPYSATYSNGTERLSTELCNVARGARQLVVYTQEHGVSTGCNGLGCEVAIGPLRTVQEITEWGVGDSRIPTGGFVLSAHSESWYGLLPRIMKLGSRVELFGANGVRFRATATDSGENTLVVTVGGTMANATFLWCAGRRLPMDGQPFGRVTLVYDDGTEERIDVAFGRDVACWDEPVLFWGVRENVRVWPASPESSGRHTGKAMTGWSWHNPHPEKSVRECRLSLTPDGCEMGLLVAGVPMADGTPLAATSADASYVLDTVFPVAVKTAEDMPIALWRQSGDTVTAAAPNGTEAPVDAASWAPTAGGLWTLTRTRQGADEDTALVTARHGLFGSQGTGTTASPARLVDADELADFDAAGRVGNGYTFELNGADGLLGLLRTPLGYRIEDAGDGLWRLVTAVGDCLYEWSEIAYFLDSRSAGPNRTAKTSDLLSISYTGDNWQRRTPAASTLTIVPPSGTTSIRNRQGTGVESIRLCEPGVWQLALAFSGTTLASEIRVVDDGFLLQCR